LFSAFEDFPMSFARRSLLASLIFTAAVALAAVHFPASAQAKKELVIGATAGPYSDQVKLGIKPILEKKGYQVRVVEFNDYIQPNFALAQGDLDANVFQHIVYLTKFATENKLAISELIKVPTAPIAVYSHKHKSLAGVKEGATVALPNDPTNAARALVVLEQIGWIKLREGYDPIRASEKDVALNIKKIKLIPLEAAQLPRSLDDTDYSFVNGNFALASGLKITEALALEKTSPTYQNVVAVRTADKDAPWVKDLADAYRSREFLAVTDKQFAGFVKTDYQQALQAVASK
jgi:D-methionine transport system substrate-binding protein